MIKYIGVSCPVCSKEFTDTDDIVVCPECGAPHHRACYAVQGRCAFEEQHAPGNYWKNPLAQKPAAPVQISASGATVEITGEGQPPRPGVPDYRSNYRQDNEPRQEAMGQGSEGPGRAAPFHIGIDDSIDGVPVKELAQFVGESTFYYLPRFKLFEVSKQALSMNLSAVIFGFFYYFNRKMYKIGTAMLALFCLTMIPVFIILFRTFPDFYTYFTMQNAAIPDLTPYANLTLVFNVLRYLYMAACLICGMFANYFYYKHALSRVHTLKEDFRGRPEQEYAQSLAIHGRTNKLLVVAIAITFFVLMNVYSGFLLTFYHIL